MILFPSLYGAQLRRIKSSEIKSFQKKMNSRSSASVQKGIGTQECGTDAVARESKLGS